MKTLKITNLLLMTIFGTIIMVSCEKSDQSSNPNGSNTEVGTIEDLGLMNDTTRIMQSVLTSQDYVLTNLYSNMPGTGAIIKVKFYSHLDGKIPPGNYTCSNYSGNAPFTFSDASIQLPDNSAKKGVFTIIDGTVSVNADGSKYTLVFNGDLSNGESFSANYVGTFNYTDNYK